jgi:hypothetical protein
MKLTDRYQYLYQSSLSLEKQKYQKKELIFTIFEKITKDFASLIETHRHSPEKLAPMNHPKRSDILYPVYYNYIPTQYTTVCLEIFSWLETHREFTVNNTFNNSHPTQLFPHDLSISQPNLTKLHWDYIHWVWNFPLFQDRWKQRYSLYVPTDSLAYLNDTLGKVMGQIDIISTENTQITHTLLEMCSWSIFRTHKTTILSLKNYHIWKYDGFIDIIDAFEKDIAHKLSIYLEKTKKKDQQWQHKTQRDDYLFKLPNKYMMERGRYLPWYRGQLLNLGQLSELNPIKLFEFHKDGGFIYKKEEFFKFYEDYLLWARKQGEIMDSDGKYQVLSNENENEFIHQVIDPVTAQDFAETMIRSEIPYYSLLSTKQQVLAHTLTNPDVLFRWLQIQPQFREKYRNACCGEGGDGGNNNRDCDPLNCDNITACNQTGDYVISGKTKVSVDRSKISPHNDSDSDDVSRTSSRLRISSRLRTQSEGLNFDGFNFDKTKTATFSRLFSAVFQHHSPTSRISSSSSSSLNSPKTLPQLKNNPLIYPDISPQHSLVVGNANETGRAWAFESPGMVPHRLFWVIPLHSFTIKSTTSPKFSVLERNLYLLKHILSSSPAYQKKSYEAMRHCWEYDLNYAQNQLLDNMKLSTQGRVSNGLESSAHTLDEYYNGLVDNWSDYFNDNGTVNHAKNPHLTPHFRDYIQNGSKIVLIFTHVDVLYELIKGGAKFPPNFSPQNVSISPYTGPENEPNAVQEYIIQICRNMCKDSTMKNHNNPDVLVLNTLDRETVVDTLIPYFGNIEGE